MTRLILIFTIHKGMDAYTYNTRSGCKSVSKIVITSVGDLDMRAFNVTCVFFYLRSNTRTCLFLILLQRFWLLKGSFVLVVSFSNARVTLKELWWSVGSRQPYFIMLDNREHIQIIYALRPRQNGCHFADDILKYIFLNKKSWISIKIWRKFVPKCSINNFSIEWPGAGQATNHYMNQCWLMHWRIHAPLGLNELIPEGNGMDTCLIL